jgi:hypothetical protein
VDFYGTKDLLRKPYELSQAIGQDWTVFRTAGGASVNDMLVAGAFCASDLPG